MGSMAFTGCQLTAWLSLWISIDVARRAYLGNKPGYISTPRRQSGNGKPGATRQHHSLAVSCLRRQVYRHAELSRLRNVCGPPGSPGIANGVHLATCLIHQGREAGGFLGAEWIGVDGREGSNDNGGKS